jgi:hypothetical protein
MKKILITLAIIGLVSCKTTKSNCDAYGYKTPETKDSLEFDIHKISKESQSKYVMSTIIK